MATRRRTLRIGGWPDLHPRYKCPLPDSQRDALPFLLVNGRRLICPWPPKMQPDWQDRQRLEAVLQVLRRLREVPPVCWIWPNRVDVVALDPLPGWLRCWERDHAAFSLSLPKEEQRDPGRRQHTGGRLESVVDSEGFAARRK
jgi:hypothetical protein